MSLSRLSAGEGGGGEGYVEDGETVAEDVAEDDGEDGVEEAGETKPKNVNMLTTWPARRIQCFFAGLLFFKNSKAEEDDDDDEARIPDRVKRSSTQSPRNEQRNGVEPFYLILLFLTPK